nr:uncharacterized protein LOC109169483 [Ipomoea batatas]
MAYDNYGHPRGNKSHYEEPQDHYQDQYEGYGEYIPQDEYHNTPSQNLYSQKAYPHNSYSKNIQYSQPLQNEKYFPFTQNPNTLHTLKKSQYPSYSQDHQDYLYYSDHYEGEEYIMQPYEEEINEDLRNEILEMLEEIKQDITHMRQECK